MRGRVDSAVVTRTVGWLLLVLVIFILDLATGQEYGFGSSYLLAVVPAPCPVARDPRLIFPG